ncbi:MAG: carbonate dehydratase [Lysobacterales bacterium]
MSELKSLLARNHRWAERVRADDPLFFKQLSRLQAPRYLWIGCSDSRVPANQILDLNPGEIFVHRNVANVVVHADLNCLSVLQFAVDVLKVEQIIVCGHYGCGGVQAVVSGERHGLVDNWLRHVGDVLDKHRERVEARDRESLRHAHLCELNVIEQVLNTCQTTVVQDAWSRGQSLEVHGLIYSLLDGRLHDLGISLASNDERGARYHAALERLQQRGPGHD